MKALPFSRLAAPLFSLAVLSLTLHAEPQWIWSQKGAVAKEKQIFRKTFTVSGEVKSATLTLTCDNSATVVPARLAMASKMSPVAERPASMPVYFGCTDPGTTPHTPGIRPV